MKIKILYKDNGEIIKVVTESQYAQTVLKTKLNINVLNIDDELENESIIAEIIQSKGNDDAGFVYTVSGGQLLKDGEPVSLATNEFKDSLRDAYIKAIADLEQIQSANLDTNAKLQLAIKGQAEIIEKLLKFIKNRMID